MSAHTGFVLAIDGRPLSPMTPARARKLLKARVARPEWPKFGTFGVRLLEKSQQEIKEGALGVDNGTKFEGYSVVVGNENPLNIKLDLPDKKRGIGQTRSVGQRIFWRDKVKKRRRAKLVHEGRCVAEVDVKMIEDETGWSPYLSSEDACKLDDVRDALGRGDLAFESSLARVMNCDL